MRFLLNEKIAKLHLHSKTIKNQIQIRIILSSVQFHLKCTQLHRKRPDLEVITLEFRKQPIIALYFVSENVLKLYNLEA